MRQRFSPAGQSGPARALGCRRRRGLCLRSFGWRQSRALCLCQLAEYLFSLLRRHAGLVLFSQPGAADDFCHHTCRHVPFNAGHRRLYRDGLHRISHQSDPGSPCLLRRPLLPVPSHLGRNLHGGSAQHLCLALEFAAGHPRYHRHLSLRHDALSDGGVPGSGRT